MVPEGFCKFLGFTYKKKHSSHYSNFFITHANEQIWLIVNKQAVGFMDLNLYFNHQASFVNGKLSVQQYVMQ
jgi:hypothetical protein